jgi:hypothetical protein
MHMRSLNRWPAPLSACLSPSMIAIALRAALSAPWRIDGAAIGPGSRRQLACDESALLAPDESALIAVPRQMASS